MVPRPRLSLAFFLLLAAASTTLAQTNPTNAYVSMFAKTSRLSVVGRVPVGTSVEFHVSAGWFGPAPDNVVVEISVPGSVTGVVTPPEGVVCSGTNPVRCTLSSREASRNERIVVNALQTQVGTMNATATITTSTPESDRDNRTSYRLEVVDRPDLTLSGAMAPVRLDPGQPGVIAATLFNLGALTSNITLTITLAHGGTFTGATVTRGNAACTVGSTEIVCTTAQLGFFESFSVDAVFHASDFLEGGTVSGSMAATSDGNDLDPEPDRNENLKSTIIRHILVTNTNDERAGSLRQALFDAGAHCESHPCTIDFRIPAPVPDAGWFTIRPEAQLPDVFGRVEIDGATQTRFTGDTNPDGPEIEISGSLLDEGNGFVLRRQCDAYVTDLAINDFPRHAIELDDESSIEYCHAPIEAFYPLIARNQLRGNERGIVLSAGHGAVIKENLISGNRRAGVFIGAGFYANIEHNLIVGNGASGIFLDVGAGYSGYASGADVHHNVIAYNGEWGVCRTPAGMVHMTENSIHGNTSAGLDIGLDDDTPNSPDDSARPPNKPVLFSATWDPAHEATIIRGRLDSNGGFQYRVEVYASSGLSRWWFPEGEEMVAGENLTSGHTDFEIVVPRDLRGKFITATNNRKRLFGWAKPPQEQSHPTNAPSDTSEFSSAIEVR